MTVKWIPPAGGVTKFLSAGTVVQASVAVNGFLTLTPPAAASNSKPLFCAIGVAQQGFNPTIVPPAGWIAIQNFVAGGNFALYISYTASGNQAFQCTNIGANLIGVICQYQAFAPLQGGAHTQTSGVTSEQAPATSEWGSATLNLEIWECGATTGALSLSSNPNSATIRVNVTGSPSGGILWADYLSPGPGTTTGDTCATSAVANQFACIAQPIG